MPSHAEYAAANNADWCSLVCRSHGIGTSRTADLWVSRHRAPPLYPDAVTLRDGLSPDGVLRATGRPGGCGIKDSFASLDLAPAGFRQLFSAEWIHRPAGPPPAAAGLEWRAVGTPGSLGAWADAHGVGAVFRPALLAEPSVVVLAAEDAGRLVGGAVANRSEASVGADRRYAVVGLSNVFAVPGYLDRVWAGAVSTMATRFPGLPMVGYERGESLAAAYRVGFVGVGPLRVWVRDQASVY